MLLYIHVSIIVAYKKATMKCLSKHGNTISYLKDETSGI